MSETDHDVANEMFRESDTLAKNILELDPNDVEATYAVALTWYHRWPPESRENCVEWLLKTEQLDPTFPWVPLYLGYQNFDTENYATAIQQFARVNRDFFASIEQHWRNLKTEELMIVCKMKGDSENLLFSELVDIVNRYIAAEQEDRPIPIELVAAMVEGDFIKRFDENPMVVASEVVRLIEGIGDQGVFPNELQKLRGVIDSTE